LSLRQAKIRLAEQGEAIRSPIGKASTNSRS
jgi:hypothetical protein